MAAQPDRVVPSSAAGFRTDLFSDRRPIERWCYAIGAVLIASGLFHLGVLVFGDRSWYGPLSWRKPATFGLSFGTTLISITWVSTYLRLRPRTRALVLGIFAGDCVLEVLGITVQAWRDVPSHFDTESAFDSVVAFSLAGGGAVLIVVLGTLAVTVFRGRVDGMPSMRLALRGGFGLLLAGLAAGVAMIVRGEVLINTGHRDAAYESAGFLKDFHGVTLHAVLVLPALAWWLARTSSTEERRTRIVALGIVAYVAAAAAVLLISVVAVL
jgi:hypothetical protein